MLCTVRMPGDKLSTYLECKINAVAEMDSLKARSVRVRVGRDEGASRIPPKSAAKGGLCQSIYGLVGNVTAFHKTNPLQFGQRSQSPDRFIC